MRNTKTETQHAAPLMCIETDLAQVIGWCEAAIITYLRYWEPRGGKEWQGRKWIWKTLEDLAKDLPMWSERTHRRAIKRLREEWKIIDVEKLADNPSDRTNYYAINWPALNALTLERLGRERTAAPTMPPKERKTTATPSANQTSTAAKPRQQNAAPYGQRQDGSARHWQETAQGIINKGAELGITQRESEIFPYFRLRVEAAAGQTQNLAAMLTRAAMRTQ